jgi:hypothetical protein
VLGAQISFLITAGHTPEKIDRAVDTLAHAIDEDAETTKLEIKK